MFRFCIASVDLRRRSAAFRPPSAAEPGSWGPGRRRAGAPPRAGRSKGLPLRLTATKARDFCTVGYARDKETMLKFHRGIGSGGSLGGLVILFIGTMSCMSNMDTQAKRDAVARELTAAKEDVLNKRDPVNAMARLRKGASSEYAFETMYAMTAIGDLGPKGVEAMPELLAGLESSDPYVAREAAFAVGRIGLAGSNACPNLVPALIEKVRRPGSDVAWFSAESLGELGPDALPALPALEEASRSSDATLRDSAKKALKKLTGSDH
jgi:hypothetical protein